MKIRESSLPVGWYPRDRAEISRFLSGFPEGKGLAAIAPHAGWYYSGKIAAEAVSSLAKNVQTVAIIGGHLPASYPPLYALEDAASTPFGNAEIDTELRSGVMRITGGSEDRYRDNTVEVLVPMVRFFIPDAKLLWMRLPAQMSSFEAGKAIAAAARDLGRSVAVLGSTDLTHYGPNYDFTPKGTGTAALRWVTEINDRSFIEAVESEDPSATLERAEKDSSSCSAGAVLGAMGFAAASGFGPARLLEYGTSAAVSLPKIPDDFVGYAAFAF